jgi:protein-disulfide isomerase
MKEKRRKRQQRQRVLIFSAIGGVILLILAIAIIPNLLPPSVNEAEILERTQVSENTMGDPNAPVKIVEYSDFQCPFCRDFATEIEPALVEEYVNTGKVHFTYRSMGQWIGSESVAAAEAAYCAGDQGKFWNYHDVLYANWNGENLGAFSSKRLADFARYLNLDMDEFNSCRSSNKYLDKVNQDRAEGDQLGVQGTPTFFINGKLYGGSFGVEGFRQAIEAELAVSE